MKRKYKGCELESPIYRQIIKEKNKTNKNLIDDYRTKRGKQSK
jgi:hypothetical protein|tara:strand:+ start:278 stop:406 length:129 start_codon:yes stop_codon:yes gene_type:complete